jgi:hypothetical protein
MGLSMWEEEQEPMYGYVLLDLDLRLRTMHVIDERGIRKKARRGELLWRRGE